MEFDGWEFPIKCKGCGTYDNNDPKEPVTFLDVDTKLCEFCFEDALELAEDLEVKFDGLMS